VSVGGLLDLDQVLGDSWSCQPIFYFDSLSKEEHKTKQRSRVLGPFLGPF
jgi:hypothetical protein